jgi:hypothetical protein
MARAKAILSLCGPSRNDIYHAGDAAAEHAALAQ